MEKKFLSSCVITLIIVGVVVNAIPLQSQQLLKLPEESQGARISQTIGLTEITITYHSPRVKGRKIWGVLVPFNQVWRAGANENTAISFTDRVKIEGKELPAGSYGLHMIPTEKDWTIIFSKNATSWGSFFYQEREDALRITVTPRQADFQEWMSYDFTERESNSTIAVLRWEKLIVPFKIEVDVQSIVLEKARLDLRNLAGFTWQGFNEAATYCLQNNINHEEALRWANRSITINKNFSNLMTKAGLLEQTQNVKEANEIKSEAMKIATENELNTYGYQLLNRKNIAAAIEIFKKNIAAHPDSWNTYDSLAETYERNGEKNLAIEYYNKALSFVKDENQKKRITESLRHLKGR